VTGGVMAGFMRRLQELARSPQGRRAVDEARRMARDPRRRRRVDHLRRPLVGGRGAKSRH